MKALIVILCILLFSCTTSEEIPTSSSKKTDEEMMISFVVSRRYYASIEKIEDSYFLSIPELLIRDLSLSSYLNNDGTLSFSNTKENINIKMYDGYLYFSMGSYYAYLDYYDTGFTLDFYPFS